MNAVLDTKFSLSKVMAMFIEHVDGVLAPSLWIIQTQEEPLSRLEDINSGAPYTAGGLEASLRYPGCTTGITVPGDLLGMAFMVHYRHPETNPNISEYLSSKYQQITQRRVARLDG